MTVPMTVFTTIKAFGFLKIKKVKITAVSYTHLLYVVVLIVNFLAQFVKGGFHWMTLWFGFVVVYSMLILNKNPVTHRIHQWTVRDIARTGPFILFFIRRSVVWSLTFYKFFKTSNYNWLCYRRNRKTTV